MFDALDPPRRRDVAQQFQDARSKELSSQSKWLCVIVRRDRISSHLTPRVKRAAGAATAKSDTKLLVAMTICEQISDLGQLMALVSAPLEVQTSGVAIALVFFGCYCISVGYIVYRSGFLPWVIGVLMIVAGFAYLINSFAVFISPELVAHLFPVKTQQWMRLTAAV